MTRRPALLCSMNSFVSECCGFYQPLGNWRLTCELGRRASRDVAKLTSFTVLTPFQGQLLPLDPICRCLRLGMRRCARRATVEQTGCLQCQGSKRRALYPVCLHPASHTFASEAGGGKLLEPRSSPRSRTYSVIAHRKANKQRDKAEAVAARYDSTRLWSPSKQFNNSMS